MSDSPPKAGSDPGTSDAAEAPSDPAPEATKAAPSADAKPPVETRPATSGADVIAATLAAKKDAAAPNALDSAAKAMDAATATTDTTTSAPAPAMATASSPPVPAEIPSPQLNLAALPATTSGMHQQYVAPGVQRQSFLASNGKQMLFVGIGLLIAAVYLLRSTLQSDIGDLPSEGQSTTTSADPNGGNPQTSAANAGMAGFDPNQTPQADFTVNAGAIGDTAQPLPKHDAGKNKGGYAQEQADLDAARALIDTDPVKALALVDQHDADYPRGILDPEARVIRVQAFAKKGDDAKALALGTEFLEDYPHSPGAGRVQAIVDAIKNKQPPPQH